MPRLGDCPLRDAPEMTSDWETVQFEHAALQQFTAAYKRGDILVNLDGGQSIAKVFLQTSPLNRFHRFDPLLCLTCAASCRSHARFRRPSRQGNRKTGRHHPWLNALALLFDRFLKSVVQPYLATLLTHAARLDCPAYLHIVVACFQQSLHIHTVCVDAPAASRTFKKHAKSCTAALIAPFLDHYLEKELEYFCSGPGGFFGEKGADVHPHYSLQIQLEAAATKSLLLNNAKHDVVKRNFLASFKNAILAPVSVLAIPSKRVASPPPELAAQTEILKPRLEGITSLFSLEIALTIVNSRREALDRANHFIALDGPLAPHTSAHSLSLILISM
ncbi:F-box protein pof6 [Neolecta irregularis DAH-3]|uniref:F-box protein pof6 n=1 Tax=Neolecta irregularis (strain DAH-3) TaxID=1198029 RepID=A0A1U7LR70_NEOID|nr:F-box protein pof6 [Neolecta irregularis DAH-3]|eukprot:OLL25129.1 F-box protein pof6 [Neolecta irregularis DAH-3]